MSTSAALRTNHDAQLFKNLTVYVMLVEIAIEPRRLSTHGPVHEPVAGDGKLAWRANDVPVISRKL